MPDDSPNSKMAPPVHTRPERDADRARGLEPPGRRSPETEEMKRTAAARHAGQRIISGPLLRRALIDSVRKLDPRWMIKSPVMFVVEIGSVLTTLVALKQFVVGPRDSLGFVLQITVWLWFTVLFANFAEALAEARGKAQADTLRATRKETPARLLRGGREENVPSTDLRRGDVVLVRDGEIIPSDGEVVEGVAYVNEAAITGESAPVLKEPGTDIRSSVTGGTQVVSDWLKIRVTEDPGHTFLDRMIALVEGAVRQKTPNEIALSILLAGLTIIFVLVVVTIEPFAIYAGGPLSIAVLIALLVCLIPTTIGALLSAIGIAGMDRLTRFNVLAMSGRAVEAAGDVDVLLLDKTGTITYGNRLAAEILPVDGASQEEADQAALWSSLGDETPEGKSIVALVQMNGNAALPGGNGAEPELPAGAELIPFSAETRMSGLRLDGHLWQKGAVDAVYRALGEEPAPGVIAQTDRIAGEGGTPLAVSHDGSPVALIYLKDTVKPGLHKRFEDLRRMGIRTVMVTGDNPLTAATIARDAGVDDFIAEAKPEDKIARIAAEQEQGHLVAMTGDGTNDAPALAQADVGMAMNSGTAAAKEAANMIDLDSDPTKLIEVVRIGKQLLITRGAITTFSIANDVAKYFAIIPAAFAATYPALNALNIMNLASPQSAILSAVIFNALIIIALIPLAMRGVAYRAIPAAELLRRNILIYGLGGVIVPFVGIKLIDLLLSLVGLA
ncbi:P-type ATPase, high-affinity potassium transport system, B chain, a phophatase-like domain [Nitrolancea hollandica Lb]|uniref:Potassium-transporting ATPase ATP-binding subunit n=2 Tax=Nitrolancea hollandica TaxID=1206749 RepID=I4ELZ7_9BACT|nr:potassium-transporting ATPase subunit KdpB [Nitrolancea hollandica]CCF85710.1 P-type ATPase, high-affinity potassium transport system, B chain, a phophatase-like domain [Nitrolancea hollandica Lb]